MSQPPTPTERFSALFRGLARAVGARSMWGPLSAALNLLIQLRLYAIRTRIYRLIARIEAGTYAPRRAAPRRAPVTRAARTPGPLAYRFGWLEPLLPGLAPYRGHVGALLQIPEVVALIQTAPAGMVRPLRSLCWMLGLKPPPILARPRPAPPPDPPPIAPQAAPAQPRPQAPALKPPAQSPRPARRPRLRNPHPA